MFQVLFKFNIRKQFKCPDVLLPHTFYCFIEDTLRGVDMEQLGIPECIPWTSSSVVLLIIILSPPVLHCTTLYFSTELIKSVLPSTQVWSVRSEESQGEQKKKKKLHLCDSVTEKHFSHDNIQTILKQSFLIALPLKDAPSVQQQRAASLNNTEGQDHLFPSDLIQNCMCPTRCNGFPKSRLAFFLKEGLRPVNDMVYMNRDCCWKYSFKDIHTLCGIENDINISSMCKTFFLVV